MSNFKCELCDKIFLTARGLQGHKRMHGPSQGKTNNTNVILRNAEIKRTRELEYYKSPKICENCKIVLPYKSKNNKFCSDSCRASVINLLRPPVSDKQKQKTRATLLSKYTTRTPKAYRLWAHKNVVGPYTKIFLCICSTCGKIEFGIKRTKLCSEHLHLACKPQRIKYGFKFDTENYPDLFDMELINEIGWYSHHPGSTYNVNGFTKDHKVSVKEAVENNYDPYYITHPLNCELITFSENLKKNRNSSISYQDLMESVLTYEMQKQVVL
jgi:hypothetical protein